MILNMFLNLFLGQINNFIGCSVSIKIYKSKYSTLKVTRAELKHNHEINNKTIDELENPTNDQDDQELIITLNDTNVRPSQIKQVLKEKRSKEVSNRKTPEPLG